MPLLFQERKKRRSAGYDDYNDDGGGDYNCTCEDGPKRDDNSADQDPIELGQAILGGKAILFPYRLSPLATLHRHRTSSHYCNQTKTNLNLFFAHAAILGDQESSKGTNQRGDPHLVKFLAGQLRYQILTNKTTNPNTITNVQMYKNNCKQINVNGFCWPTVNRFQIPKIQIQTPMYLQVTFKALQNTHCGICHEQTNHYEQPRDWIVGKANLEKCFFSCPGQLNRWPCHSLSQWVSEVTFDFCDFRVLQSCCRH